MPNDTPANPMLAGERAKALAEAQSALCSAIGALRKIESFGYYVDEDLIDLLQREADSYRGVDPASDPNEVGPDDF